MVYRTARCGLRVTRAQRNRLFGLLRSAGDVWCCVLDLNRWRRQRQDPPAVGYQQLCRELTAAGPRRSPQDRRTTDELTGRCTSVAL